MRILHVTDAYLPQLGGIEMHVNDLVRRQRVRGHDADIVTSARAHGVVDPAWVRRIGGSAVTGTGRSLAGSRHLAQLISEGSYDVVHAHASVISPLAMLAAGRAGALGVPAVVTVHSLWSRIGPVPSLLDSMLRMRSWPVVWSGVSAVASDSVAKTLGEGVAVHTVPNGVDPDLWKAAGPEPAGELTIVCVTRLARRKRPLPLLRMLRQLRRAAPPGLAFRVLIVGDGPERDAMERYLRLHDMTAWVSLLGRLDRVEIRDVLRASHLFVAPAELESFGIAALEARCAGLPVVASTHGGVGEFVRHGVDGLLASSDDEMVQAMLACLTQPALRNTIAAHNRATSPLATWAVVLDETDRLYDLAHAKVHGDLALRRALA